jgi:hypothetical protein
MSGIRPWAPAVTALRRVCGVAALLGLFAMHGLAVHGAMHAGHGAGPTSGVVAVGGHNHNADRGADDVVMPDTGAVAPFSASQKRTPDPDPLGFAGLCLAVLLAGLVMAVLLSRSIRLPGWSGPVAARGWPARARRDRGPPCLFALSIHRC